MANGISLELIKFSVPTDKSMFDKPFEDSPNVPSLSMSFGIETSQLLTRDDILASIKRMINKPPA